MGNGLPKPLLLLLLLLSMLSPAVPATEALTTDNLPICGLALPLLLLPTTLSDRFEFEFESVLIVKLKLERGIDEDSSSYAGGASDIIDLLAMERFRPGANAETLEDDVVGENSIKDVGGKVVSDSNRCGCVS